MPDDFLSHMQSGDDLSEKKQIAMGQPASGSMGDEHTKFVKIIAAHIKNGEINVREPQSLLNQDVYQKLDAASKAQIDLALVNVADLLRHIAEFYMSEKLPDESPQLQNMIEQLWQMTQRVKPSNVFKF